MVHHELPSQCKNAVQNYLKLLKLKHYGIK